LANEVILLLFLGLPLRLLLLLCRTLLGFALAPLLLLLAPPLLLHAPLECGR
jgi:hypothetical protein